MKIDYYLKAALAFIVPGVTALGVAITAGSDGGATITQTEWLGALFACVLTAGTVYVVPNKIVQPDPTANTHGGEPATDPDMVQADPEDFGTADSEADLPDHQA